MLGDDEARAAEAGRGPAAALAKRWYIVSEECDERKLADQLRRVTELRKPRDPAITRYVSFTTTDCNARCRYCYELIRVPECDGCLQYPTCVRLKKCAWHADGCTERNRAEMRINLSQRVLNEYSRYGNKAKEALHETG